MTAVEKVERLMYEVRGALGSKLWYKLLEALDGADSRQLDAVIAYLKARRAKVHERELALQPKKAENV